MAWTKAFFIKKGKKGGLKTKASHPADFYKQIRAKRKNYKRKPHAE